LIPKKTQYQNIYSDLGLLMPGAEHWIFKRPIVPNDERKTTGSTGTIQLCNTQLECLNLTSISICPVGASYHSNIW